MANSTASEPSHYEVLGLDLRCASLDNGKKITPVEVKRAYRESLLRWHPDKFRSSGTDGLELSVGSAENENINGGFTVDQIRKAYQVLSNEGLRREYDRLLGLSANMPSTQWQRPMERLDLDDFTCQEDIEGKEKFTRTCRCGEMEGFTVTSGGLDEAANMGIWEVEVECAGCSLGVVVEFGVKEE